MSEGIQETKDVVAALDEISLLVIKLVKDGVQLMDAVSLADQLLLNDELKTALSKAIDGISKVPAELGDLDAKEIMDLVGMEVAFVPKVLEALKA